MVVGGVAITNTYNKEQAKPAHAENEVVLATYDNEVVMGTSSGYDQWNKYGWKISFGGDYSCGFDKDNWRTIEEQGFSKYVDGTVVTEDRYGFVIAKVDPMSYVGSFDFISNKPSFSSHLYLTYSLDDVTYSLVPLTSGEQGWSISGNTKETFNFNTIRRAYYAIVVVNDEIVSQNQDYLFRNLVCNFYENVDPNRESMTVSGLDNVYVDEEIEITATAHNFSPVEYTWISSDESVLTITGNGNTATVRGVGRGTASITVSATGTSELIYIDPFVINVKEFKITNTDVSIDLPAHGSDRVSISYQDPNGSVVAVNNSIENDIIRAILEPTSNNKYYLHVYAKEIAGVTCSFDVTLRDNNGEEGYHEATITVQVNVAAKQILSERMTSRPALGVEVPIYLGTIDGSRFLKMPSSSSLAPVNDIKDAYVFYINHSGRIRTVSKSGSSATFVTWNLGQYTVTSSSTTSFNIINDINDYPGVLSNGNNRFFMYIDSQEIICSGNLNDFDYYIEEGIISPSNVFCAYEATEVNTGIYPEETAVDLNKGESTSIDTSLVFVNDIEYEIISGASCIDSVTIANITNYTETSITITASDTRGTAVIRVKDANDDSVYTDITVRVKIDAETVVGNLLTQTQLSYHYEGNSVDGFVFSNVSIRFGAKINKDVWNQIDNDYGIDGFGVMITAYGGDSFSITSRPDLVSQDEFVIYDLDNWIADCYMPTSGENSMATPPEVDDDYVYNLFHRVNENNERYRVFTAAAYIKLSNGNYLFMQQVRYSVSSLAADYLANRGCDDTTAGGSLAYLAGPQA